MSSGSDIGAALTQLQDLCESINTWTTRTLPQALHRAPFIDWHHPDDYTQKGIAGLRKFQGAAEAERDHVAGILSSPIKVKEFNSNAPHLVAVWDEFLRACWPLGGIAQSLDVGAKAGVKVDVIARGGSEWIKVNTVKEARLLAEFREQDSYVNSDYDSDTSSPGAGPSTPPAFTNSLIVQGEALLSASAVYPRPAGRSPPIIRMILTRLIRPRAGFSDDRIEKTISHLESLGIVVQLGPSSTPTLTSKPHPHLRPTNNVFLDLSVLVALCCDSTHFPLPTAPDDFEARFRSLRLDEASGTLELGDHSNTSKDLRDQLVWESQHPLIQEMKDRLGELIPGKELRFWITEEVRDRLPALIDIIGGPAERRRGKALLRGEGKVSDFWVGSRWEGNEGVLRDLRVEILPKSQTALGLDGGGETVGEGAGGDADRRNGWETPPSHLAGGGEGERQGRVYLGSGTDETITSQALTFSRDSEGRRIKNYSEISTTPSLAITLTSQELGSTPSQFQQALSSTCQALLYAFDNPPPPESIPNGKKKPPRRSRSRPSVILPANRSPSGHTIRTMLAAANLGWTVLSNNRGAVGKVGREMGIGEGLSWVPVPGSTTGTDTAGRERDGYGEKDEALMSNASEVAAIWVVNPSSLSEWRRLEVLRENGSLGGVNEAEIA